MTERAVIEDTAAKFFAAVEAKDAVAVEALYDQRVRVWHSRDATDTDRKQNLALLRTFWSRTGDVRYDLVRRYIGADGFMQQHVVRGELIDGGRLEIPVSFVALVADDGLITRIEEYCNHLTSPLRDVHQGS